MQPNLLDAAPRFDGATFDLEQDQARLGKQLARVLSATFNQGWLTLAQIERETGYPQASISARLRDFRKEKHGAFTVERRRVTGGLYEYRVSR